MSDSATVELRACLALIAVLALLTAVAPLALDMYLPALPEMATELGTTAAEVQLTLTACLVGLGVGQLFAARLVQGLSGAVGVVLARAVIADTARGSGAAKLLGTVVIISVLAPVVAPLGGGAIIALAGWCAVFWVLAGLALVAYAGALLFVRESLPLDERGSGGVRTTRAAVRETLANRNYVGYLLTSCFAFAALFAHISASPFVMQNVMGLWLPAVRARRRGVAARGSAGGADRRAAGDHHVRRAVLRVPAAPRS